MRELQPDCVEFNPSSVQQLQQLLFAPFKRSDRKIIPKTEEEEEIEEEDEDDPMKIKRVMKEVNDFPLERAFKVEKLPDHDYGDASTKLKFRNMTIKGLGIPPVKLNATGLPSVDTLSLKMLQDGALEKYFK